MFGDRCPGEFRRLADRVADTAEVVASLAQPDHRREAQANRFRAILGVVAFHNPEMAR